MRSRTFISILGLGLFLGALQSATAQTGTSEDSDLLLRVNAPVTIAPAESASTVWVIGSDAIVRGSVREQLIVMGGTARVTGTIEGGIAVFGGDLELGPNSRVGGDVFLYRSTMAREPGASVAGTIEHSRGPAFGQGIAWAFWASMTLVVVCIGLLFAALGGRQLQEASATLRAMPLGAAAAALLAWGATPFVVAFSFATLIGIPLGLAILLFLLPALGFAGYVVAGTALGSRVLRSEVQWGREVHPYREVALGLVLLQAAGFVPVLGALLVLMAAAWGAGALIYRSWSMWRRRPTSALVPAPAV
jgi:hypothetical protein